METQLIKRNIFQKFIDGSKYPNYTSTRPAYNPEKDILFKYKGYREVVLSREETLDVVKNCKKTDYNQRTYVINADVIRYINSKYPNMNLNSWMNSQFTYIYINEKDIDFRIQIKAICELDRERILKINKRDKILQDKTKEKANIKRMVDTFYLPTIKAVLSKYKISLDMYEDRCVASFDGNQNDFKAFFEYMLNQTVIKEFKDIGLNVKFLNDKRRNIDEYSALINFYDSAIIDNIKNEGE